MSNNFCERHFGLATPLLYGACSFKQPRVFSIGCVCHLANLCLLAGVKELPIDFFVDLYYYFDKSSKRKEMLHEFQEFTNTKELKILKHCKTRWLRLDRAVKRVLNQWDALYAYFDREAETDHSARVLRLDNNFKSYLSKLIFLFLEFALESLCKFNSTFQSTLPMLPALKTEVKRLLKIFLARFVKLEIIRAAGDDVTTVNLSDFTLQVQDKDLSIGHKCWAYMNEEEDSIDTCTKKQFFGGIRKFYVSVASTIIKKFSFDDHVLDDLSILMPENQASISTATVLRLADRFPSALPDDAVDHLEEEVLDYTLVSAEELPATSTEARNSARNKELCSYWQGIGKLTTLDGSVQFPYLASLAKCLLSLPHSNADTERVFSIVRKIVTDYRTEMDQSLLCALIACKLNCDTCCFKFTPSAELFKVC